MSESASELDVLVLVYAMAKFCQVSYPVYRQILFQKKMTLGF